MKARRHAARLRRGNAAARIVRGNAAAKLRRGIAAANTIHMLAYVAAAMPLRVRPSVRPSVCPSFHPSIHPSVHPSIRPSVYVCAAMPLNAAMQFVTVRSRHCRLNRNAHRECGNAASMCEGLRHCRAYMLRHCRFAQSTCGIAARSKLRGACSGM